MAERDVTFESDGRKLVGKLFDDDAGANRPSRPGVLFIHGYGSDMRGYRARAEAASAAMGGTCLTFDLGGHGKSSGTLTSLSVLDHRLDALAALDKLVAEPGIDPNRIGVCGASYGGYLAAVLVSERPVSRLLLRAPALGEDGSVPSGLSTFTGAVMVVESGEDEVVPKATIEAYLEACGGRARHEVIEGASHALTEPQWQRAFVDLIVEWFHDL